MIRTNLKKVHFENFAKTFNGNQITYVDNDNYVICLSCRNAIFRYRSPFSGSFQTNIGLEKGNRRACIRKSGHLIKKPMEVLSYPPDPGSSAAWNFVRLRALLVWVSYVWYTEYQSTIWCVTRNTGATLIDYVNGFYVQDGDVVTGTLPHPPIWTKQAEIDWHFIARTYNRLYKSIFNQILHRHLLLKITMAATTSCFTGLG